MAVTCDKLTAACTCHSYHHHYFGKDIAETLDGCQRFTGSVHWLCLPRCRLRCPEQGFEAALHGVCGGARDGWGSRNDDDPPSGDPLSSLSPQSHHGPTESIGLRRVRPTLERGRPANATEIILAHGNSKEFECGRRLRQGGHLRLTVIDFSREREREVHIARSHIVSYRSLFYSVSLIISSFSLSCIPRGTFGPTVVNR